MDYSQRRKQQAQQTEQAILRATIDLSRQRPFDKVSVREICQQAGITTGAFYHHFKSKEDLLERGFAPLDLYMEQALAPHLDEPPIQRLWIILSSYAAFMEHMGCPLVARYYQHRLETASFHSIDPNRYTLKAMLACLEEAAGQQELLPIHTPQWLADFLFRHFRGVVIDWILHQGSYSLLPKLEQDYQLFQEIFRPQPKPD